jgi:hypothetical protein
MHGFLTAIENFFKSAWGTLVQYLRIAIPDATAAVLNDLLQAADPIVSDLQNQNLTGPQKREAAFTALQGVATKAAWDVGASLVNVAIELAVQKIHATQSTAPVAIGGNLAGGVIPPVSVTPAV